MTDSTREDRLKPSSLGLLKTLKSVLWAMMGVRAKGKAEQDFTQGRASHFIIIGILFAVVFISVLSFVVNTVLPD